LTLQELLYLQEVQEQVEQEQVEQEQVEQELVEPRELQIMDQVPLPLELQQMQVLLVKK